jgi:hypothetical protein
MPNSGSIPNSYVLWITQHMLWQSTLHSTSLTCAVSPLLLRPPPPCHYISFCNIQIGNGGGRFWRLDGCTKRSYTVWYGAADRTRQPTGRSQSPTVGLPLLALRPRVAAAQAQGGPASATAAGMPAMQVALLVGASTRVALERGQLSGRYPLTAQDDRIQFCVTPACVA